MFCRFIILYLLTHSLYASDSDEYVLLISMDGFRYDYLEKAYTPNFDKIVKTGASAKALVPIFISKTFPNHYSIATGMYAENHGLIANSFYAPDLDKTYSIRDRKAVENGQFYDGEPIWVTAENQGVKTASYFWVGSEASINGVQPTYWKRYDQKASFESRIDTVMTWFSYPIKQRPRLALLYFHEPDGTGHEYGPNSPEIVMQIERLDNVLGNLISKINKLDISSKLNIIIVSDHGMTDVYPENSIDLSSYTDLSLLSVSGAGPTVFISSDSKKLLKNAYNDLKSINNANIYWKNKIPKRFHYRNHVRIPDILVLADEGWSLMPLGHGSYNPKGSHGYDNLLDNMKAIFIANGPSFKSGYKREEFENIHIYPLVAHILGIKPYEKIDGDLETVKDLLSN
ncbi:alkaline phosphatase family protein [bacterium]|nr:MAG: alkaline phosphatase family protein [bacterium]